MLPISVAVPDDAVPGDHPAGIVVALSKEGDGVTVTHRVGVRLHLQVTGEITPPGVSGELCTRGYSVMHSYWGEDAKTRPAGRDRHERCTRAREPLDHRRRGGPDDEQARGGERPVDKPLDRRVGKRGHPRAGHVSMVAMPGAC